MVELTYLFLQSGESNQAALPIAISIIGTVVVFVLARLAMFLYRNEDMTIAVRKFNDLDVLTVRLIISIENHHKGIKEFHGFALARSQDKQLEPIALMTSMPIQRSGHQYFVKKDANGYALFAYPNTKNEAVLEFRLPAPEKNVYLTCYDEKGQSLCARISLSSDQTQQITFVRSK